MNNVRLTFSFPTARTNGRPLALDEIAYASIEIDAGAGAVEIGRIDPVAGTVEFLQTELDPGDYLFSVTTVDTQTPPARSPVERVAVSIRAADPGPVTGLTAEVF